MQRPYAIIEAPSVLGLKPTGVDRLATSLLANGLAERVNAQYAGRVEPPAYSAERDTETELSTQTQSRGGVRSSRTLWPTYSTVVNLR
jgi:hypothetical protein